MLIQLVSLKVGSMRTGYTASASFTTTASAGPRCKGGGSDVAQVSKPAVSPISKSAGRANSNGARVWKPAIQQTWKSALLCSSIRAGSSLPVASVTRKRL